MTTPLSDCSGCKKPCSVYQPNFNDLPPSEQETMIRGAVAKSKEIQDAKWKSYASPKAIGTIRGTSDSKHVDEEKAKKEFVDQINLSWRYGDGSGKVVTYLDIVDQIQDSMDALNYHKKQWIADLIRAVGEELLDIFSNCRNSDEISFKLLRKEQRQKLESIINELKK